jgi:hypothetical protein
MKIPEGQPKILSKRIDILAEEKSNVKKIKNMNILLKAILYFIHGP